MTEKRPEMRRWRRIVLPASLVLNLFLIALIGGHLLRRHLNEAAAGTPSLARALANAEASLSPSDAAAFGAVLRRDAPQYAAAAKQFEEAREVLQRQIVVEPFNQEAVRQALAVWQASWVHFIDNVGNPLVEALAQVSPAGRQRLVAERRQAQAGLHAP